MKRKELEQMIARFVAQTLGQKTDRARQTTEDSGDSDDENHEMMVDLSSDLKSVSKTKKVLKRTQDASDDEESDSEEVAPRGAPKTDTAAKKAIQSQLLASMKVGGKLYQVFGTFLSEKIQRKISQIEDRALEENSLERKQGRPPFSEKKYATIQQSKSPFVKHLPRSDKKMFDYHLDSFLKQIDAIRMADKWSSAQRRVWKQDKKSIAGVVLRKWLKRTERSKITMAWTAWTKLAAKAEAMRQRDISDDELAFASDSKAEEDYSVTPYQKTAAKKAQSQGTGITTRNRTEQEDDDNDDHDDNTSPPRPRLAKRKRIDESDEDEVEVRLFDVEAEENHDDRVSAVERSLWAEGIVSEIRILPDSHLIQLFSLFPLLHAEEETGQPKHKSRETPMKKRKIQDDVSGEKFPGSPAPKQQPTPAASSQRDAVTENKKTKGKPSKEDEAVANEPEPAPKKRARKGEVLDFSNISTEIGQRVKKMAVQTNESAKKTKKRSRFLSNDDEEYAGSDVDKAPAPKRRSVQTAKAAEKTPKQKVAGPRVISQAARVMREIRDETEVATSSGRPQKRQAAQACDIQRRQMLQDDLNDE